jgi:hypothetical protein
MNFHAFRTTSQAHPVISDKDIGLLFPGFDRNNLLNWQLVEQSGF